MAEHRHEDVRRLFDLVLDVPADQRASVLERECGGDEGLKRRILAMLAAAEDERFLGDATAGVGAASDSPSIDPTVAATPREQSGQAIGRYKLLQPIGEGGFGTVWMAEQKEPVKRRVALKIIKLGMDTKQVVARFEAERQALAMMDHPNIARVLDAGATDTGRPYFVMEYIRGIPILEYCDTEKLDTDSRLELFMQVCHAIQHAHQKGIIHRDIKPSNVLITLHDGKPVPKVIDFGIAKATNSELTNKTLFTEHRQMIGTPAYMSPEQAEMSGLDIDTRSDIYSLGVLLYELLTGTTPFENAKLLQKGYAEMMRIIREEEPHKPSTRLSTLGETATRTAQQRRADVGKLGSILRGDLDWIVMKCLEKDRTRRYETANGVAADIRRHLNHEPVVAGPPSMSYRARKFFLRNKASALAGSAIAAAILLGLAISSVGLIRAQFANERLGKALVSEELARERAEDAEELAENRATDLEVALDTSDSLREEAVAARAETERVAYPAALAAAAAAISQNDAVSTMRFLDGAPEAHRGFEWDLLRSEADRSIDTFGVPTTGPSATTFSADGTLMVVLDQRGSPAVFNTRTREVVHQLPGAGRRIHKRSTFSPDGRWLAVEYIALPHVDIFDLTTGNRIIPGGTGWASRVASGFFAFSADSTRCILRGSTGTSANSRIRIWELDPWKDLGPLESHWAGHVPSTIAFSPDGRWLVMGADIGHPMRIFDAETFDLIHEVERAGSPTTIDIVFNDDSTLCATYDSGTGKLCCYATADWQLQWESGQAESVGEAEGGAANLRGIVRFVPRFRDVGHHGESDQGQFLAVIAADGALNLFEPTDGMLRGTWRGEGSLGVAVGADAETGRIYSAHLTGVVKVWDSTRLARFRAASLGHMNSRIRFLSNGRGLITSAQAQHHAGSVVAYRIDPRTGRGIGKDRFMPVSTGHTCLMSAVAESPDGQRLVMADQNGWSSGRLRVIDQATGLALFTQHSNPWGDSRDVAWSPDGRLIAVVGNGGGPALRDGNTYEWIGRLDGVTQANANAPRRHVMRCAFSADGNQLIACETSGTVRAWDASTLASTWETTVDPPVSLNAMAYTPDGSSIVAGGADGSVIVLSAADGRLQHRFDLHGDQVTAVILTPDGSRLITGSRDGTLRFVDTTGWRELLALPVARWITDLAVSDDGNTLAIRADGMVQVLDRRPEVELAAQRAEDAKAYETARQVVDAAAESGLGFAEIRSQFLENDDRLDDLRRQFEIVLGERITREFDDAYDLANLQEIADPDLAVYLLGVHADTMPAWNRIGMTGMARRVSEDPSLSPAQRQAVDEYARAFRGEVLTGTPATWFNDIPWKIVRQPGRPTSHYQLAEYWLRKLTERQPESWFAHSNLALALMRMGQYEEAIVVAERTLDLLDYLGESDQEPRLCLVFAQLGLGDRDAANQHLEEIEQAMAGGASRSDWYLLDQARAAMQSSNWAREESADRLRRLADKAQAEDADALAMARYARELHLIPYEPLRDLDLALEWAERAVDQSIRDEETGIYRLRDLLEVHEARNDSIAAARVREDILRAEEQELLAAGNNSTQISQIFFGHLRTHIRRGDTVCVEQAIDLFIERYRSMPVVLNNVAWAMLTERTNTPIGAARALTIAEVACAEEEAGNGSELWRYLDTLAYAQHELGDFEQAVAIQRRAVSLMPVDVTPQERNAARFGLARHSNYLATAYRDGRAGQDLTEESRYLRAIELTERCLEIQTALYGSEAKQTLGEVTNIAVALNYLGRHEEALELLEPNYETKVRVLGPQHEFTLTALRNIIHALDGLGHREEAVERAREHLSQRLSLVNMRYATAGQLHSAAKFLLTSDAVLEEIKAPDLALEYARRSVELAKKTGDRDLWHYLDTLAIAHHQAGDTQLAIVIERDALDAFPDTEAQYLVTPTCGCKHFREDLEEQLREFEAALAAKTEAAGE